MEKEFNRFRNYKKILLSDNISLSSFQIEKEWNETLFKAIGQKRHQRNKLLLKRILYASISVAAVFVLAFYINNVTFKASEIISPGKIYAQLETPAGNRFSLDSLSIETLRSLGIIETNTKNDFITSSQDSAYDKHVTSGIEMVRINVPLYSEYKLTLSDGTQVWLNSGSVLEFEKSFNKKSRRVFLEGEGYFKVTKDSSNLFTVQTTHCKIAVYGTSFNVKNSDNYTETSLVEGSVSIESDVEKLLIEPGFKGTAYKTGKITTKEFDVESTTAWTRGEIIYKNEKLGVIMKELCQWYNAEVIFADSTAADIPYSLFITRTAYFEEILRTLEKTDKIKVKINKNVAIISMQ